MTSQELIAMNAKATELQNKVARRMTVCSNCGKTQSYELGVSVCEHCNGALSDENNRHKFERLASKRMANVLRAIELLGNCAGVGYDYTDDHIAKMTSDLNKALTVTFNKFNHVKVAKAKKVYSF